MSSRSQDHDAGVQSITTAAEPLSVDLARRTRRYLWQMSIRAISFVLAVLTWNHIPVWASVGLLIAAVVLPYVAVLLANAGRERPPGDGPVAVDPRGIGPGAGVPSGLGGRP
ncbi:DUF3099 domain-containing protein [Cellulomonas endophytica]|uniref:DUF3099 domain-containing protein n=1 Tax=Cellulomonas endophytica TaxID=2494735 RepID=UPI001F0B8511|nr:DUF3099 domain-containing protein [Cellulomonas endophytica]